MDETQVLEASQEQPSTELAVSSEAVETADSATSTEPTEPVATSGETEPTEQLILGKFKSNEEVLKAYQHSQAEASRMAAELAGYKRGVQDVQTAKTPAADTTPKYTVDQLEYAKVDLLTNLAAAQAQGDSQKARELAGNIAWCDREIRKQEFSTLTRQQTQQTATSQLENESLAVVQKYQADIQAGPGNQLYDKAASLYNMYMASGMPDNNITRATAIALAANLLGRDATGVAQTTRKEMTTTLQKSLKAAVQAGAGKADTKASATPNFETMSDKDFIAWKKQNNLS